MGKHRRFLLAFMLGAVVAIGAYSLQFSLEMQALLGASSFFLCYLALVIQLVQTQTPADLRRTAEQADEGLPLILLLALAAVGVSLTAIALVLNGGGGMTGHVAGRVLALVSVPLGWATVHALIGLHYAHAYYQPDRDILNNRPDHLGGLQFPSTKTPDGWDFLYFSFGVGMTAQVSDVVVTAPRLRKMVLVHAVGSFFYNTVILALAVNAAVTATL